MVGVAFGAGLVLLGATRVWSTETIEQAPPLSPQVVTHTGSSLVPALPALAVVALAAAGGLLATRGLARRLVGALLVVDAVALVALLAGRLGDSGWAWACLVGALLVGAAGALTVRDAPHWPEMGRRYARPTSAAAPDDNTNPAGLWDAIERGHDPTRD